MVKGESKINVGKWDNNRKSRIWEEESGIRGLKSKIEKENVGHLVELNRGKVERG